MAYASASDVAAFCQNLLNTEDSFTSSTCPTLGEVTVWLSSGCSIIETFLANKGYSVPVSQGTVAYNWIKDINTFYGVYMAELSRTNIITSPGERTRAQQFERSFWDGLEMLQKVDLTGVGLSQASTGTIYAGGTKQSEKDTQEADTDRVKPRFYRGQFATPGALRPDDFTIDYGEDE